MNHLDHLRDGDFPKSRRTPYWTTADDLIREGLLDEAERLRLAVDAVYADFPIGAYSCPADRIAALVREVARLRIRSAS